VSEVVLHVAKASGISGSENHLLALLPALRERGWDVRFVLLHEDEPGAWELAGRLDDAGVPLEGVRLPRAADPLAFSRILRAVRRQAPSILHTHLVHADFHGLTAGRLARVPVLVSTKHGFNAFRTSRAFAAGDRAVGALADVNIAISTGLARYLEHTEGFAPDTFDIVHYGIEARDEPSPPPAEPRLAIVGRLIPIKGHGDLLAALERAALPELSLEVAGDGPLREELEAEVAGRRLGDTVRFLGRVAPADAVFERAALVVVPSHGEGFGMVALEAMERGRAVIASAVGGLPEIVEDGVTGLLVPAHDPDALAAAIRELATDPARCAAMGAAGRERALTAFSQERCTLRTEELYRGALASAARRPRRSRRRVQERSSANAASRASRKSHGAR
jgi:glycosyltransferase involved in cell wall biosynthesis